MITPMEIYQREFRRRALNGLDPRDVEEFLFQVAEDMETLLKENSELKQELQSSPAPQQQAAAPKPQGADPREQANAEANRIRAKASAEAKAIVEGARMEAEQIRSRAAQEPSRGEPDERASDERMKKYQDMLVRHLSQVTLLLDEEGAAPETEPQKPERTETTLLDPSEAQGG